jgi:hypothetical protein
MFQKVQITFVLAGASSVDRRESLGSTPMYTTTCERPEAGCARLSASVPALMEDQQNDDDDDDGNHDR